MAAAVDPAVPHYVYLNIRLREEYRPVITYLCHYGDTDEMFLGGGLVANDETPYAAVARYLKELGGFILDQHTRFHLVSVTEDVMNYEVVKISLFLVDLPFSECTRYFRTAGHAMNMARHLTEKLNDTEENLPPSTVDCEMLG